MTDAQFWDDMYGGTDQLFSGSVNGALVVEVADLPPGRALDVGCGEGADAVWLAKNGWRVTAIDISRVALDRAAALTTLDITWIRGDLASAPPAPEAYDLVSAQYFPLPHEEDHTALRSLLNAVAVGGTLLFVGHDLTDLPHDFNPEFHPSRYYQPAEIAELLDDTWAVEVDETRPRAAPPNTHHVNDNVLRAKRLG